MTASQPNYTADNTQPYQWVPMSLAVGLEREGTGPQIALLPFQIIEMRGVFKVEAGEELKKGELLLTIPTDFRFGDVTGFPLILGNLVGEEKEPRHGFLKVEALNGQITTNIDLKEGDQVCLDGVHWSKVS